MIRNTTHPGLAHILIDPKAGAVVIPNTVAMIARCRHPDEARLLIDYLLSAEVEKKLAQCPSAQIPLGTDLADFKTPWGDLFAGAADWDVSSAAAALDDVVTLLKEKGMDR
jgi:ABC-type Fe3+ transport system substrate-binding protein